MDIEHIYRAESRRVFATLVRLLGDFDRAEEAVHDAFMAAMEQWPRDGLPENPRAWLVSAGRFRAIDALRRRSRFNAALAELADRLEQKQAEEPEPADGLESDDRVADDRLRLVFTCCHPSLPPEMQVALTLREVCGLTTEEIARAFLVSTPTLAQRIVRGKARIRDANIPYAVPERSELPQRLNAVLAVIYLVFNEGYSASGGDQVTRAELSAEAIRLGRLLLELLPDVEAAGLLALMLLQESRRSARISATGDLILLEDQDRSLWDRPLIEEGLTLAAMAMSSGTVGGYTLQAAIAAEHGRSVLTGRTDWARIVDCYDLLLQASPSPVVELNRAVAIAMQGEPAAGLAIIDDLLARGELANYHLAYAAQADLSRRLGQLDRARTAYHKALSLARQEPERRFLQQRLDDLTTR